MNTANTSRATQRGFQIFLTIWTAQLIARIGNGLTAFGLGVYLYQQTGLATPVAMVTMAAFFPSVLLAPFAGVLADRIDRRLLMILGDSASVIGLLLLVATLQQNATTPIICACVILSSICNSVMDPAYRATVTDLLTPEEYARASGMVQLASAAQYLLAPVVAGFLISKYNIVTLVTIDICTMATTIICMVFIWKKVKTTPKETLGDFWSDFQFGIRFLSRERNILTLLWLITLVTFCMGFIQTLFTPLVLDLSNEQTLGMLTSLAASGMLVASILIGVFNMGNNHIRYLSIGLICAGISVSCMGTSTYIVVIGIFAFLFFCSLPPMNTSLEVLVRSAIPNETQGRIWGLISLLSQFGFIFAYAIAGPLVDHVFNPLLTPNGPLASSIGVFLGVGDTRGIGLLFIIVGIGMAVLGVQIRRNKNVYALQENFLQQLDDAPPATSH
ncbi:MFS transporter [Corynebacterium freiburgense]|uniref:MFS transporter n=1 Tax=Corynebacterium freiburgense TaxID=556548 RepID=UPI000400560F|nr:MFS transporter [Corynebacterium freiburgense]WJZ03559.1 enterobactin exporter EntS [Corynebacterium freiburgense]